MPNETTIRIKINPERAALIDEQVTACGLNSRAELFNDMAQFFFTAIEGIKTGAQPGLYTPDEDTIQIITTPGLETAITNYLKTQKIKTPQKPKISLIVDNTFEE